MNLLCGELILFLGKGDVRCVDCELRELGATQPAKGLVREKIHLVTQPRNIGAYAKTGRLCRQHFPATRRRSLTFFICFRECVELWLSSETDSGQ